jgi:preprotein translocase subunit SecA
VQQAATNRLRQAAAAAAAAPAQAQAQGAPAAEPQRGAFGQRTDGAAPASQPAPQNRAQRRAAGNKK